MKNEFMYFSTEDIDDYLKKVIYPGIKLTEKIINEIEEILENKHITKYEISKYELEVLNNKEKIKEYKKDMIFLENRKKERSSSDMIPVSESDSLKISPSINEASLPELTWTQRAHHYSSDTDSDKSQSAMLAVGDNQSELEEAIPPYSAGNSANSIYQNIKDAGDVVVPSTVLLMKKASSGIAKQGEKYLWKFLQLSTGQQDEVWASYGKSPVLLAQALESNASETIKEILSTLKKMTNEERDIVLGPEVIGVTVPSPSNSNILDGTASSKTNLENADDSAESHHSDSDVKTSQRGNNDFSEKLGIASESSEDGALKLAEFALGAYLATAKWTSLSSQFRPQGKWASYAGKNASPALGEEIQITLDTTGEIIAGAQNLDVRTQMLMAASKLGATFSGNVTGQDEGKKDVTTLSLQNKLEEALAAQGNTLSIQAPELFAFNNLGAYPRSLLSNQDPRDDENVVSLLERALATQKDAVQMMSNGIIRQVEKEINKVRSDNPKSDLADSWVELKGFLFKISMSRDPKEIEKLFELFSDKAKNLPEGEKLIKRMKFRLYGGGNIPGWVEMIKRIPEIENELKFIKIKPRNLSPIDRRLKKRDRTAPVSYDNYSNNEKITSLLQELPSQNPSFLDKSSQDGLISQLEKEKSLKAGSIAVATPIVNVSATEKKGISSQEDKSALSQVMKMEIPSIQEAMPSPTEKGEDLSFSTTAPAINMPVIINAPDVNTNELVWKIKDQVQLEMENMMQQLNWQSRCALSDAPSSGGEPWRG